MRIPPYGLLSASTLSDRAMETALVAVDPELPHLAPIQNLPFDKNTEQGLFSRQTTGSSTDLHCCEELGSQITADSESQPSGGPAQTPDGCRLPRDLALVGFLRHAPKQVLSGQFDRLRKRHTALAQEDMPCEDESESKAAWEKSSPSLLLPRASPYVGFQRHAPPSPSLSFAAAITRIQSPVLLLTKASISECDEDFSSFSLESPMNEPATGAQSWPGSLPEEVWAKILGAVIEVPSLCRIACIARGFPEMVASPSVWSKRPVRVSPAVVAQLAPQLGRWLMVWEGATKLILPRSSQLLAEVARRAPVMPVEIAWRFDQHLKGDGVEVLKNGLMVKRIAEEELVVLGDAALVVAPGRAPYLEVCLDVRGENVGDGLNDFGFGVTASDPEELRELGAVADEVPCSWVVDFTQCSVVLSVNNHEATKGRHVTSKDLRQGDRVGLRLTREAVEVYINGALRECLVPPLEERVPMGICLFPVVDLYGCTVQISRTDAEEPLP